MNNAEIQIQFPRPGQWDEFNMTAIYQDADGYTRTTRYTPEEIPADQAPAMQAVGSAPVGLGEDLQGGQGWGGGHRGFRVLRGGVGVFQTQEGGWPPGEDL